MTKRLYTATTSAGGGPNLRVSLQPAPCRALGGRPDHEGTRYSTTRRGGLTAGVELDAHQRAGWTRTPATADSTHRCATAGRHRGRTPRTPRLAPPVGRRDGAPSLSSASASACSSAPGTPGRKLTHHWPARSRDRRRAKFGDGRDQRVGHRDDGGRSDDTSGNRASFGGWVRQRGGRGGCRRRGRSGGRRGVRRLVPGWCWWPCRR